MKALIPYGKQWIDSEDIQSVVRTLRSDFITQGPRIEEFEKKVARYCGAKYAVAFSSGTAALHASTFAVGIRPGDEVVTSPISFVATANSILFQGAQPVFSDIELETINLDPSEVEKKITRRTKAILAVDFAGHPAPLTALRKIAEKRKLFLLEDGAHALGATYHGKRVGPLSDVTVFSFHPVKAMTTGEGGMALAQDKNLERRLRLFRNHGMIRSQALSKKFGPWYYTVEDLGYNYRITDIQCSLGISQLKKIEKFIRLRRNLAERYHQNLREVEEIILPQEKEDARSAYHLFVIQLRLEKLHASRRTIFEELRESGVGVNVHYLPIPLQPYYRRRFGYQPGDFPRAELYYERAITLPLFPQLKTSEVDYVTKTLKRILARYRK